MCGLGLQCSRMPERRTHEEHQCCRCRRNLSYGVTGRDRIELKGDEAWHAFLERMAIMAMDGYEVVFWNENQVQQGIPSKDVVTYTTADEKDAISWCNSMFDAGYKVSMTYDTINHVFVCIAIK